ncbi:TPA: RES family NAD+ phosphorylase, partial [Vibrio vulnificus]|nr:RES domain-containing protein [Vibrio vulnificus]HDY7603674.1 RES family NAD+ phosphorylase [Vibrio vulnificus]HDY7713252.1 RES family NAD+ phosphorylase [Vibrio vulnificus]
MDIEFSKLFLEIDESLRSKNRFSLPTDSEKRVEMYCQHYMDNLTEVPEGTEFFRARVWGANQSQNYRLTEMGSPPAHLVGAGRINPEGISYLYGAKEKNTAVSEVRPWVGAKLSLVKFTVNRDLKLVDLAQNSSSSFNSRDHSPSEIFHGLQVSVHTMFINKLFFSAPAHEKDRLAYITSQFIAERFKALGADGILYPSVLNEGGLNICIFDPQKADIQNGISKVEVKRVVIEAI